MASGSTIGNASSSVLMRTLRLRHTAFVVWLASTVVSSACASLPVEPIPKIYEAQQAVDRYITSGRYDADFARVVEDASAYLEERARLVARPAIVLDIDETALTNWPAYKANGWVRIVNGECNLEQGPCGLRAWQATAQSKALKPTLELDKRAKSLGVAVFFITGRPSNLRDATERNLREQGFEWDEVILAPPGAQHQGYRSARRMCRHTTEKREKERCEPIGYFPPNVKHVTPQIASFTTTSHSVPGCVPGFSWQDRSGFRGFRRKTIFDRVQTAASLPGIGPELS